MENKANVKKQNKKNVFIPIKDILPYLNSVETLLLRCVVLNYQEYYNHGQLQKTFLLYYNSVNSQDYTCFTVYQTSCTNSIIPNQGEKIKTIIGAFKIPLSNTSRYQRITIPL